MGGEPACVRPCVRAFVHAITLSNMNISATSGPIATKFYLKHQWGGEKAAFGFWPDRIGTLVFMATDSSHGVYNGGNLVSTLALDDNHNIPNEFEFQPDSTKDCGVSCP